MTKLAIRLFGYDNAQTIKTRTFDGKSWYMADKICVLLGISNYSQAVHKKRKGDNYSLDESEYRIETIYTGKNNRNVLMVNDSGLVKLIFQAKPEHAADIQVNARKLGL